MTIIETHMLKNGTYLHVVPDYDAENPRGFDNAGCLVLPGFGHIDDSDQKDVYSADVIQVYRAYEVGDIDAMLELAHYEGMDAQDISNLVESLKGGLLMPVYCYKHGNIAFSTGPFSCPWDSGQAGFIYMETDTVEDEFDGDLEKAEKCLKAEVDTFSQFANGEVYGFVVTSDEAGDGTTLDSCFGFFGSDVEENGMLDHAGAKLAEAA